ncbi:hypothetical protein F5Y18DRAFT_438608 [Xylariaceae sp. FL1019]|nr:hypothetical protein F5Y18DRAFT_438608 [Xylariaceae sp. FL1019]
MSLFYSRADSQQDASRVPEILGSLITTWILAATAVCLRIASRRLSRFPIWWDDWFVMGALVWATAETFTISGYMVSHGLGRHILYAPKDAMKAWAIGLFISEMTYPPALSSVKYSSLCFYWRIFSTRHSIRPPIWILAAVVTVWLIAVLLVPVLQCFPAKAFWERFDPDHPLPASEYTCPVNAADFFLANAIPNMITDAAIVLLPIPYVLTLKLRTAQRVGLLGIFLLGIFVTVISGIRLLLVRRIDPTNPDVTWTFVNPTIWSGVETNLAIVACCLPSLMPIYHFALSGFSLSKWRARKQTSTYGSSHNHTNEPAVKYPASNVLRAGDSRKVFERLSSLESHGRQIDEGSVVELTNLNRDNITITKEFRIESSRNSLRSHC